MACGFGVHPLCVRKFCWDVSLSRSTSEKWATQPGSRAAPGRGPAGLGRPRGNVDRTVVPYFNPQGADTIVPCPVVFMETETGPGCPVHRKEWGVSTVLTARREGIGGPWPTLAPSLEDLLIHRLLLIGRCN